ncbi:copper ion binding protein [Chengkuizengella sediminis]|uniref:copper ion binding protein n=1 Tax=Chengkuizengella sediminis TaxID=1885917 RepID=UPI001389CDD5|nr:copper ion binding protein [Chengkuizengella sediminis]NDI37202.1 heavy-metal-associated domain-containing protein [Chengkuizengella sediminis]
MKNQTLKVEGMSCNHCVNAIESTLKEMGVKGSVDLKNGSVEVNYEESNINLEAIKEAIEEQGYDVV